MEKWSEPVACRRCSFKLGKRSPNCTAFALMTRLLHLKRAAALAGESPVSMSDRSSIVDQLAAAFDKVMKDPEIVNTSKTAAQS
jgi:hypothetical protein